MSRDHEGMRQSHEPMRFARSELGTGVRVHCAISGSADGDPLLFLHGWPDSWFTFSPLLPLLPQACRAISIDQRGFGESSRPARDFRLDDFAADAAAVLDALAIERATIIGHSFGSFVARRLALSHPERVKRLVLIGSGIRPANPVTLEVLASIRDLADPIPETFVREFQSSTAFVPLAPEFFDRVIVESLKAPARVWRDVFTNLLASDDTAELGRIAVPTLLLWGDRDALFSRADQDALLAAIPGARLHVYEAIGHCPNWECPEQVVEDLMQFMKSA